MTQAISEYLNQPLRSIEQVERAIAARKAWEAAYIRGAQANAANPPD